MGVVFLLVARFGADTRALNVEGLVPKALTNSGTSSNRVNVFSTAKFADRRELLEGARTKRRDCDKRLALGAVCSAFT